MGIGLEPGLARTGDKMRDLGLGPGLARIGDKTRGPGLALRALGMRRWTLGLGLVLPALGMRRGALGLGLALPALETRGGAWGLGLALLVLRTRRCALGVVRSSVQTSPPARSSEQVVTSRCAICTKFYGARALTPRCATFSKSCRGACFNPTMCHPQQILPRSVFLIFRCADRVRAHASRVLTTY